MKPDENWPNLTAASRARLVEACQRVGVNLDGKWLSEAAVEAIERLEALLPAVEVLACGKPRSPKWPTVRKHFLEKNPKCAACGGTSFLEVHHVVPYHLDVDLELDEGNLLTLCDRPGLSHHLMIGHLGDWKKFNGHVVEDAALFLSRLEEAG